RQVFVRRIQEVLQLSEFDDVVETAADFCPTHAVQARGEVDVFANRKVTNKPAGELNQRGYSPVHFDGTFIRQQHTGDQLKQRRLALTVAANDPDGFAVLDGTGDVAQSPKLSRPGASLGAAEQVFQITAAATVATEPHTQARDRHRGICGGRHHSSFST